MDQGDIEGVAVAALKSAGFDGVDLVSPARVAAGLAGTTVPIVRTDAIRGPAALCRAGAEWRIYVRRRLSPRALRWFVWHEVAELALRLEHYEGEDVESVADAIAAAMRLPRRAFISAASDCGDNWAKLSRLLDVSQSAAALRWGEVLDEPLALVAPSRPVRVRGATWTWPDVSRATPEGARRQRLSDAPRRSVVRVLERGVLCG